MCLKANVDVCSSCSSSSIINDATTYTTTATATGTNTTITATTTTGGRRAEVTVVGLVDGPVGAAEVAWRDKGMNDVKGSRHRSLSSCRSFMHDQLDQTSPVPAKRFI